MSNVPVCDGVPAIVSLGRPGAELVQFNPDGNGVEPVARLQV